MLLWQARMELLMVLICCLTGALVMRVCHTVDPVFDDPNLIGFGGLAAVMSLAQRAGLHDLVDQHVRCPARPARMPRSRWRGWWRGWSSARTASATSTSYVMAGWAGP